MTNHLGLSIAAGVIGAGLLILILVLTCMDRYKRHTAVRQAPKLAVDPYFKQYLLQTGDSIWWLPFWQR